MREETCQTARWWLTPAPRVDGRPKGCPVQPYNVRDHQISKPLREQPSVE